MSESADKAENLRKSALAIDLAIGDLTIRSAYMGTLVAGILRKPKDKL